MMFQSWFDYLYVLQKFHVCSTIKMIIEDKKSTMQLFEKLYYGIKVDSEDLKYYVSKNF